MATYPLTKFHFQVEWVALHRVHRNYRPDVSLDVIEYRTGKPRIFENKNAGNGKILKHYPEARNFFKR